MKVLFLSQRVPFPPDRGDRITTYHFLQHFLEQGASIRVGALSEEARDAESVEALRGMVDSVCAPSIHPLRQRLLSLRGLLTGAPLTRTYFHHPELARTVDAWVKEDPPDVVYVYSSSMAQYVTHHPQLFRFMQFAELDSDKWRQFAAVRRGPAAWIYRREFARLLEFERDVARSFAACAVVSEVEKKLFMEHIPDVTPLVLPNGVDVDHFQTTGDEARNPHTVIFTGVMNYEPNVKGVLWFADTCWPAIRQRVPDATFLIVGSHATEKIFELGRHEGIQVLGRVPEIPPYMDQAAVAVAPLKLARGVQNKVLEAMATALPVVASSQAAQGLGPVGSDTLVLADHADDVVAAIVGLLEDPQRARRIGENAAAFVREHFRWENQYEPFDRLLAKKLPEPTDAHRVTSTPTINEAGTRPGP